MVDKPNYKKDLTPEQYEVCWNRGAEPPFSGKHHDCKGKGIYKCVCCGNSLFTSDTKFDSGTGWPSFWTPINRGSVKEARDKSFGMIRTEVMCAKCGAHLGHVFDDGPEPTRLRYCINSLSLSLERENDEEEKKKNAIE
jgi:peptide-methionine (R)-S-oxide reductase